MNPSTSPLDSLSPSVSLSNPSPTLHNILLEVQAVERHLAANQKELHATDAEILVKKQQLEAQVAVYNTKIAQFDNNIKVRQDHIRDVLKKLEKAKISLSETNNALKDKIQTLRELNNDLREIKEQIVDRRSYLNEQEYLVAQALDKGSEVLQGKQQEINAAETYKEDLLKQTYSLKEAKEQAENGAQMSIAKYQQLEVAYTKRAAELKTALHNLQTRLTEGAERHNGMIVEADERLREASIREKELAVKQEMLEEQDKNLKKRELRYKSNRAISNI